MLVANIYFPYRQIRGGSNT